MFLGLTLGFILGFLIGIVSYHLSNKVLNKPMGNSMINAVPSKSETKAGMAMKRRPRVLTDSMAYLKELEEEGQNRE